MVYSSLKSLLELYPYFIDKSRDSNFTKTRVVWNNRMIELYDDIFKVYLAGKITKHILIWKEQSVDYVYKINFAVSLPNLKKITCYKNNKPIYIEEYEYDDLVDNFHYIYNGNTQNEEETETINFNREYDPDTDDPSDIDPVEYETPIIPEDKFRIDVETYAEYHLSKGYPENDEPMGDIYDHDKSLDDIGAFFNVTRKNYIIRREVVVELSKGDDNNEVVEEVIYEEVDYKKTEPPYNNRLTEDDYHYMKRLLYYSEHLHDTPLPLLELWKLFGDNINATMTNRERLLCKMFDENKHLLNGVYNESWKPHRWEHKDSMCSFEDEEIFFFANVNNSQPLYGRNINFKFSFFNSLIEDNYDYVYVKAFIELDTGELELPVLLDYHLKPKNVKEWFVNTKTFYNEYGVPDDVYELKFIFRAYKSLEDIEINNYIEADELYVIIKGCNNADFYVNSITGNDNNIGDKEHPFKSVVKAVNMVEASRNVIVLQSGVFGINKTLTINKNTSILCCSDATILNSNSCDFFSIKNDTFLDIQNVLLKYNCCEMYAEDVEFINNNKRSYPFIVTIPLTECKIPISINIDNRNPKIYAHTNYTITGDVKTLELVGKKTYIDCMNNEIKHLNEPDLPVGGEKLKLYKDNTYVKETTTDSDGEYSFDLNLKKSGQFEYWIKHEESKTYCGSKNNLIFKISDMPTYLSAGLSKDKIYIDEELPLTFYINDYYGEEVECGEFRLYVDDVLVKTINYNETDFHYIPSFGEHTIKLVFVGDSYVSSAVTGMKINVVKYNINLLVLSDKNYYVVGEETKLTGYCTDDYGVVAGKNIKCYIDNVLIGNKNTNADGECNFNKILAEGTHNVYLTFDGDDRYYPATSNNYRVKVRKDEIADINLHLYPEYKIVGDVNSVVCHVYAHDKNNNPLRTSFKMWSSYDIKSDGRTECDINSSLDTVYTTDETGWCTFTLPLNAFVYCNGELIQAISTLDNDIYSEVVFIRKFVDRPLEITDGLLITDNKYSYADDLINFNGWLSDEEENRIPNQHLDIKLETKDGDDVNEIDIITDYKGEFDYGIVNMGVRKKDLKLILTHERNDEYGYYTDYNDIVFYPPKTNLNVGDIGVYRDEAGINIIVSAIDENNRPVIDGVMKLTIAGNEYNYNVIDGVGRFNLPMMSAGSYNGTVVYNGDGYYQNSNKSFNVIVNKLDTSISLDLPIEITYSDEFSITGRLWNVVRNKAMKNVNVDLFVNNVYVETVATDNNGDYRFRYTILDNSLNHSFKVVYNGDDDYKYCESIVPNYHVNKETSVISYDAPNVVYNDSDYVITGSLLTDDGELIGEKIKLTVKKGSTVVLNKNITPDSAGGFVENISGLAIGDYSFSLVHEESDNYTRFECGKEFKVKLDTLVLSAYVDGEVSDDVYVDEIFIITVIDEDFEQGVYKHKDVFENLEFHIYDSNDNELIVNYEEHIFDDATIYTVLYEASSGLPAGDYKVKIVSPESANHEEQIIIKNVKIKNR